MADTGAGEKLKVFLSYSRKDSAAFADELVAGLEVAGFARSSTAMTSRRARTGRRAWTA